jgi:hypothetical protein
LKHRIGVYGVLNAMNLFNGISGSTLSRLCLADGIPFTGPYDGTGGSAAYLPD